MKTLRRSLLTLIATLSIAAAWPVTHTRGQTLSASLEQQTNFLPQTATPVEQLVEVAQHFKIPMAIEWLERSDANPKSAVRFSGGSVSQLVDAILQQSPEHQLAVEDRMLRIFSPAVVSHPYNFLNLQVARFQVTNESLFGAEAMLRTRINMLLYPELYRHGYGGGYGGASDSAFWVRNISISAQDLTIREILTKIAKANGNAGWVVRLTTEEMAGAKPKWDAVPINDYGHSPINARWRFIALNERPANARVRRTRK